VNAPTILASALGYQRQRVALAVIGLRPVVLETAASRCGCRVNARLWVEDHVNGPTAAQVDADLAPSAIRANDQGRGWPYPRADFHPSRAAAGGPARDAVG